jgi:hypothetical protein
MRCWNPFKKKSAQVLTVAQAQERASEITAWINLTLQVMKQIQIIKNQAMLQVS